MLRPKNKDELLEFSNTNFNKMFELIESFGENEVKNGKIPFEDRDKNIRDILAHLHHWHLMVLKWYKVGMSGEKPDMPASGYTWKTVPELNQVIWEKYQTFSYDDINKLIKNSFLEVQKLINQHTNDELFQKKKYKWTGTTSIGSYLTSGTSSHYDWAMKKLKKYKKAIK
ncbi:ClbS/DfsB family four-helix bundle protein [Sulfurimonas sp.]|uniref:ClbS/DfsB family four-helix bundle protein n=1 Tax=Sulfurimonas sp. TaxID=2022749 RepID=UPI0025E24748|nr:ClbS/DfsB family four-helix bundle protein [Sulfurimonas sp.]